MTQTLTAKEALHLIATWNSNNFINKIAKTNKPEVWAFKQTCRGDLPVEMFFKSLLLKVLSLCFFLMETVYLFYTKK